MKTLTVLLCSLLFACSTIPFPDGEPDVITDAGLRVYGDIDTVRLDWIATWTMQRWAKEGVETDGMLDGLVVEITDEDLFTGDVDAVAITYAEEEPGRAVLVRVERGDGRFSDYTFFHEFSHVALDPTVPHELHHGMMLEVYAAGGIPIY